MSDTLANVEKFTFSNFTNCEEQGQGGEATVYKGLSGEYGDVAIKSFFKRVKVDNMREVELLIKHCHHPNIVQLYGVLVADMSSPLIQGYVMEYMPNGSLEDVIHNPALSYSWTEISSWIQQISRGLGYLHGREIIHRDIKPSNLLLGNRLELLKISDFGLAKQVDVGSHTSAIGTCWYMAPEVIQTRKYSFSADIYSLAITLWELFCRQRPYYHLDQSWHYALLNKVIGGERPLFENFVDETVVTFLTRAWTANPDQRPALTQFMIFADTVDVQINWNINGQCLDNATSSDIRPNALATALQAKLSIRAQDAQQTSVSEVPLLIGGEDHFIMEILDVETNTWKELSLSLPYEAIAACMMTTHVSAYLDGEIYIFCGWLEKKSAYKLTKEMKWTKLPDMVEWRIGISNSTVVFDGCIWVIGGKDISSKSYLGSYLNQVEAYDPKSNSWIIKPEMNTARSCAAAAVLKGKIFVCGGYEERQAVNSVEYFDAQLSKWIFFTPMPSPRYGLAAVVQDSLLTAMGGRDHGEEDTADVWRMNVDDSQPKWSVLASMNSPRAEFAAWILDGRIMVAGGFHLHERTFYSPLSSVEVFDGKEWTEGPSLQRIAACMTTTLVPQNLARSLLATFPPARI